MQGASDEGKGAPERGEAPESSPSWTSTVLRRERGRIMRDWASSVRSRVPSLEPLPQPLLFDHLESMLEELAAWIDTDQQEAEFASLSEAHGIQRLTHGLLLREVVTEYRVLRQTILRVLAEHDAEADPARAAAAHRAIELSRLNTGLDFCVTSAVEVYAGLREEAVTALKERLQLAVDVAELGTWDYDTIVGSFECDERCRAMMGLPPGAAPVPSPTLLSRIHPDDQPTVTTALERLLSGATEEDSRLEIRTFGAGSEADERWLLARARAFKDGAGRVLRVIGTVADVTERRRLDEARQRFVGVLGHDLRTPLQAVMAGASFLALPEVDGPTRVDFARRITASARRMDRLIRDLLDVTHAQLGTAIALQMRPTSINEVCRKVIDELSLGHPSRRVEYRGEGEPRGEWDPDRIEQVVSNLVMNALKYSPPDSTVRVRWYDDGEGQIALEVHNEGPSIPADLLPHIFRPYRMGPQTPQTEGKSMGLGLFIVSQLVHAHGGSVDVASADGQGTTFTVHLPRAR